jgi:hypothetical protein
MAIIAHPQTASTSPRPDIKAGAEAFMNAGGRIMSFLEKGKAVPTTDLRQIMTEAFDGSDAEGLWL